MAGSRGDGVSRYRFQAEVLDKGGEQKIGIGLIELEERHFGLVIAKHGLYTLVVENAV